MGATDVLCVGPPGSVAVRDAESIGETRRHLQSGRVWGAATRQPPTTPRHPRSEG